MIFFHNFAMKTKKVHIDMIMIDESLAEYIEREILPKYDSFDKAHNRLHAERVIADSIVMGRSCKVANINMVYAIAAYHDLGLCRDRRTHHIASGEIVMADANLRRWFSEEECQVMKEAVEDHRASASHAPRSIYGMIVAEADKDLDTMSVLRRTVQYGLTAHAERDREFHFERFTSHLQEKYAEGGYLKLWLDDSPNRARLEELRRTISNDEELRRLFNSIYDEETKTEVMAIRLTSTDSNLYGQFADIFMHSFPEEERRPIEWLESLIREEPLFHCNVYVSGEDSNVVKAILCYWDLSTEEGESFIYIEYLAVAPEGRNKGTGGSIMHSFIKSKDVPVVLEAELPTCPIAQRRIRFYERLGFRQLPDKYIQPSYGVVPGVELRLMLYDNGTRISTPEMVEMIKRKVYRGGKDIF